MRVLLSKPDALGDQLIAAGVVQELLRRRPDVRLVWHVCATREAIASVIGGEVFTPRWNEASPAEEAARLAAHPGRLVLLPFPLHAHEAWSQDLRRRLQWWHDFLRATRWDASVLGLVSRNWVGDFTAIVAPAARRFGFEALPGRQPLVNDAQRLAGADHPSFTATLTPSFDRGEAVQLLELFTRVEPSLGAVSPPPLWSPVPPLARSSRTAADQAAAPRQVALAPGVGGDPRRAWPLDRFVALAEEWRARGAEVVWIEGPGDAPYLAALPAAEQGAIRRFDTGELPRLATTLAGCDLLVCHDTAYTHLTAGLGTPTVAIFGGGQRGRFHPPAANVKVVQGSPACAGCQWHCLFDRLLCVTELPLASVQQAIRDVLAGRAAALTVTIATPLSAAALTERLQHEVLYLNADRFARLQIIQSLLAPPDAPAALPDTATIPTATPPAPAPAADGAATTPDPAAASANDATPHPAVTPPAAFVAMPTPAAADAMPAPAAATVATPPGSSAAPAAMPTTAPASAPRLSVIIPMGRPERVAGTLRSLRAQAPVAGLTWEIVLVGTEAGPVAAAHPQLPIVPVVLAQREIPPKTRCLGVERARGEWFLFVDDDVELAPEFLLGCAARLDLDPRLGALGPRLPGKSRRFFGRVTDYANFWAQQDAAAEERDWLYSAAILVRAEAYRRSGGFDPHLPNGEDVDLTRRIRAAGYTLRYDPALVAWHDHGRDTFGAMCRYFWRNGNAAQYFFGPHGGACCFSLRAALTRPWADWRMNAAFRARHGESLGWLTPWVILAYAIVETSLEYHYQAHLAATRGYEHRPARTRSDRAYVRAMHHRAAGRRGRGALLYAWAVLLDFATPSRR
jgi:ADP-heptose:LPS heptosyltransferase/GT2 family glycosyltransferase